MENLTSVNKPFKFVEKVWITNISISVILSIASLYLLAVVLHFYFKVDKQKKENFSNLTIEKKYAVLSKYTCIVIACMSVYRNLNSIVLLIVEVQEVTATNASLLDRNSLETACDVLPVLGNFALSLGTGSVYFFLWIRQRVFYVHPSLKVLNNRVIRIISSSILFFWLIFFTCFGLCYVVIVRYHYNQDCLIVENTVEIYGFLIISYVVVSMLMQIALLGLFINPILKRTSWRQINQGRNSGLLRRVKKAIFLTAVCLLSDMILSAATYFSHTPNQSSLFATFSINLVINHLVTIGCYDQWKKILLPFWHSSGETATPALVGNRNQKLREKNSSQDNYANKTVESVY